MRLALVLLLSSLKSVTLLFLCYAVNARADTQRNPRERFWLASLLVVLNFVISAAASGDVVVRQTQEGARLRLKAMAGSSFLLHVSTNATLTTPETAPGQAPPMGSSFGRTLRRGSAGGGRMGLAGRVSFRASDEWVARTRGTQ